MVIGIRTTWTCNMQFSAKLAVRGKLFPLFILVWNIYKCKSHMIKFLTESWEINVFYKIKTNLPYAQSIYNFVHDGEVRRRSDASLMVLYCWDWFAASDLLLFPTLDLFLCFLHHLHVFKMWFCMGSSLTWYLPHLSWLTKGQSDCAYMCVCVCVHACGSCLRKHVHSFHFYVGIKN